MYLVSNIKMSGESRERRYMSNVTRQTVYDFYDIHLSEI